MSPTLPASGSLLAPIGDSPVQPVANRWRKRVVANMIPDMNSQPDTRRAHGRPTPHRLRVFLWVCLGSFVAAFVVQTVFQWLGAQRSHWGGNPGWQREIAFWNVAAALIAARALQLGQAELARAVAQGFTVLFLLLGTNHLFAAWAAPAAQFHWPPLVLNALGFVYGLLALHASKAPAT